MNLLGQQGWVKEMASEEVVLLMHLLGKAMESPDGIMAQPLSKLRMEW